MISSTKDLFWLVLSFVVLWIGLFMGWGVLYLALMLRDAKRITGSIRKKIDFVDQILEIIKNKVETTANYLPPLIEGAGKLMEHFKAKRKTKKPKKEE